MSFEKLSMRFRKKNTVIVDGYFSYCIRVDNDDIYCPCSNISQNFCNHLLFLLYNYELDLNLMPYWSKLKKHILSNIIKKKNVNSDLLWKIVKDQIFNGDCGFCLEKIFQKNKHNAKDISQNIHVCSSCQGILHTKCFEKWNNKGNGCMLCRAS